MFKNSVCDRNNTQISDPKIAFTLLFPASEPSECEQEDQSAGHAVAVLAVGVDAGGCVASVKVAGEEAALHGVVLEAEGAALRVHVLQDARPHDEGHLGLVWKGVWWEL